MQVNAGPVGWESNQGCRDFCIYKGEKSDQNFYYHQSPKRLFSITIYSNKVLHPHQLQ
jgi:hypothetical protein